MPSKCLSKKKTAKPKARLSKEQQEKLVAQEIKKRAQKFKAASAAQKRVLIAQDVLAQIAANRYKPETGHWLKANCGKEYFDDKVTFGEDDAYLAASEKREIPHDASVQKLFLGKTITKCSCCALGSLMMSCTLYSNKQTAEDLYSESESLGDVVLANYKLSNGLNRYFSKPQLELIEIAFEGSYGYFGTEDTIADISVAAYDAAILFHETYTDPTKRLKAIMNNVIKNKGTFKP